MGSGDNATYLVTTKDQDVFSIKASGIADYLKTDLIGNDIHISSLSSIESPKKNSLVFAIKAFHLGAETNLLILCTQKAYEQSSKNVSSAYIICSKPRLAFAKVVEQFFVDKRSPFIHETAVISESAEIRANVSIGAHCVISQGCIIGEGTSIKNNVTISENVQIGKHCSIKSGAIIGEEGFGFENDSDNIPQRLPHLGRVIIGNNVEIGSNSVIARGTIDDTIINDNVKIDDLVFVAHNVIIQSGAMLTACTQVSGSVVIGKNSWLGPNSSIIQKVKIGNDAVIGIGTSITSNVGSAQKIMGISGLSLRLLVKFFKILKS